MAGKQQQTARGGRNDQLLREWVYLALTSKADGTDATQYARLVKEFSGMRRKAEREGAAASDTVLMLTNFIVVLKDFVSLFRERYHDTILTEVLGIKLWTTAPSVRTALLDLVSTLVVVNTSFTQTCLRLLVASLLPPPAAVEGGQLGDAAGSAWSPAEAQLEVQGAITSTLIKVLGLVPTAPVSLMQLVSNHMPHKLRDRNSQCLYFQSLFALAEAPAGRPIRDALLAAAVEHLLSLDVEIRWEDIADTVNEQAAEEQGDVPPELSLDELFELEGMHELDLNATPEQLEHMRQERLAQLAGKQARGGWEGGKPATPQREPQSVQDKVDETANKLDSLMELTFAHLERRCQAQGGGGAVQAWLALVSCFERTILNAHRSKFSQYLVFFLCHRHPEPCVRLFADFLITRLQDARLPPITRSACAAYVASFLARCAHVPHLLVLQAVEVLVRFAEHWAAHAVPASANPASLSAELQAELGSPTGKHQVFFATVQAILYTLCYHMRGLLAHQHAHNHRHSVSQALRALLLGRVLPLLAGPMQPLRVLLPSVVAEFRAQLASHGLADAVPGLAQGFASARVAAAAAAATGPDASSATPLRPLEMFFPFDPYLLRRSSRLLELPRSYVYWRRGGATRGRAAEEGASVSDEEDGEEADEPSAGSKPQGTAHEEDEDGDLELHSDGDSSSSDSSDDSSSSGSDDDDDEGVSVRGGSVGTSQGGSLMATLHVQQHMVRLPRAQTATAALGLPPPAHRPSNGHAGAPRGAPQAGRHGKAWAGGSGAGTGGGGGGMVMGSSYDPMATSYNAGHGFTTSSMGDATPLGTSPVVVDYGVGGQSFSPMQMTPVQLGAHMETAMGAAHGGGRAAATVGDGQFGRR